LVAGSSPVAIPKEKKMDNTVVVWRMPLRIEACQCTECPIDSKWGCSSTQTIRDAWPEWFLFHWLPRRAVCAIFGHREKFKMGGKWYSLPGKCDRCLSKKIILDLGQNALVVEQGDTAASNTAAFGHEGSIPSRRTKP
jgi:hypothetical protein